MKDQHTKIKGYRDLSQQEIDLMNRIKAHGEETKKLLDELRDIRLTEQENQYVLLTVDQVMESDRALNIAEQHLQTGQMWFVRAVALPDSF